MKKLLTNSVLFFVLWIVLNIVAHHTLSTPVLYGKYNSVTTKISKYNKFLLADSHGNSINQKDLDQLGIGNFSFDSDSYFDLLVKTNYLIEHASPDTLFITCDDHTLSKYRESWTNRQRSIHFSNYEYQKKYYRTSIFDFVYRKYIKYYLSLMDTKNSKIFKAYVESKLKGNSPTDYSNFSFGDLALEEQQKRSRERIETQYPNLESSELMAKCLDEIINLCAKNRIVLIGIKFPLSAPFIEALGANNYGADAVLKAKGIEILDLKMSMANNISLFRDQDHLNNLGSAQLPKLLLKEILLVQNSKTISGASGSNQIVQ